MSKNYPEIATELTKAIRDMRQGMPAVMGAFKGLADAATAPGALDTRVKELIALAIAVAVRCDGCVAFHSKAAQAAGATREEVLETLGMAIYMGGGPSMVYGAEALRAFDQFADAA